MDNDKKKWLFIIVTFFTVFIMHNAQYIMGYAMHQNPSETFTPFAYKAPFSLSEDNLSYASLIRYSGNNPSLYRPDPLIKENNELNFADGHIVPTYVGVFHKIFNDINITYYFASVIPILISIILIFKTVKLSFQQYVYPISFSLSVIILCSNFDDFLGIGKFLTGFIFTENYHSNFLVLGYAQRFVFCQASIPLFLFWIYRIVKFGKAPHLSNQLYLSLSLILLQYTYFYYWSFAIPITIGLIILTHNHPKQFIGVILPYLLLTAHFWYAFIQFNQLEFSSEYLYRIRGSEYYQRFWIILFCSVALLPQIKKGKAMPTFIILLIPIIINKVIGYLIFHFSPQHYIYITAQVAIPVFMATSVIWYHKVHKTSVITTLLLLGYYLMFLFCFLKFFVGFSIQPYHWVYASFFPFLILTFAYAIQSYFSLQLFKKVALSAAGIVIIFGLLNSFKSAERNYKFWTIGKAEKEVISFLNQYDYPVVTGNNMMANITFTGHTDIYLYRGTISHKRSSYPESYNRYIHPYKLMGYNDSLIVEEYKKYEGIKAYHEIVISNNTEQRDSLAKIYPDNLLATAEALHCYLLNPAPLLPEFKTALKQYEAPTFDLDFLIIYKPTFRGNYSHIKGEKVFENSTFIIYKLNSMLKMPRNHN